MRPEDVPKAFEKAWNNHDVVGLGALFHDDATFVNRFGHLLFGARQIIELHGPIHETIYSGSSLQNELIDATEVSDGVVISHFWSRLRAGIAHPAGPHEIDTVSRPAEPDSLPTFKMLGILARLRCDPKRSTVFQSHAQATPTV